VQAELDAATWPGTGRLVRLPMSTLCEREISLRTEGRLFLDHLADAGLDEIRFDETLWALPISSLWA